MDIEVTRDSAGRDNDLETGVGRVENGQGLSTEVDGSVTLGVDQVLAAYGDQGSDGAAGRANPSDGRRRFHSKGDAVA